MSSFYHVKTSNFNYTFYFLLELKYNLLNRNIELVFLTYHSQTELRFKNIQTERIVKYPIEVVTTIPIAMNTSNSPRTLARVTGFVHPSSVNQQQKQRHKSVQAKINLIPRYILRRLVQIKSPIPKQLFNKV